MKNRRSPWLLLVLVAFIVLGTSQNTTAQSNKRVVQLSGVVMGNDSVSFLPGVHIYVPKAGRGTTSNGMGFFSLPVLIGDSIVISAIGYQRVHYIVPKNSNEYQTIIVTLVEDVTFLKEIEIVPFPTEEVFKEAILALNIPDDEKFDKKNLNAELLALMIKTTPADGPQNQRYALDQWANSQGAANRPLSNPLLNPFNWVKFFNSLKTSKKK